MTVDPVEEAAERLVEANLAFNRADHVDELTDEIELEFFRAQRDHLAAYNAPYREAVAAEADVPIEDEE